MARTSTGKRLLRSSPSKTKARRCHSLRAFVSCGGNIPNISLLFRLLFDYFAAVSIRNNTAYYNAIKTAKTNENPHNSLKVSEPCGFFDGCASRSRTCDGGVKVLCLTAWRWRIIQDSIPYFCPDHKSTDKKTLPAHSRESFFLYLSRLSHSGSWASTATRYSARSCWISCRCDPSAAVA